MIRVRPERFVAGGETLARASDGRVVFVRGGMPGDEVTIDITEERRDWSRGHVVEIHEASPNRVEPPCEHRRAGCGGCDWQHIRPESQLAFKVGVVVDALRRTAKLPEAAVRAFGSVPSYGYRTSIRVVGDAHERAAFRIERSNQTVSAAGCLIAHPGLLPVLDELHIPTDVEVSLRLSASTGELTALWDQSVGEVGGLPAHATTGPDAVVHETVGDHSFRVSAGSFFQSGPAAAALLVESVRSAAPELATARRVLDAYAGVGLFALAATAPTAEVITVESSPTAIADCRVNLAARSARIESGEVGRWRPQAGEDIDVVIADPSRTGLAKPGVAGVVAGGAPVVVLVSCDPVALARDTSLLAASGYLHAGTDVLDLFPETHHVEAVTRFVLAD